VFLAIRSTEVRPARCPVTFPITVALHFPQGRAGALSIGNGHDPTGNASAVAPQVNVAIHQVEQST
jgi:hypothetical protein